MNRPPIEQARRLVLVALVLVALAIAGSYGLRRWRAYQARRGVPASIPTDLQQQTEKFTFSRSEGGRTLFTVEASRTIERAGRAAVLEGVVVRIYGRHGERADEIRTGRCEYDLGGTGTIRCPEEVTVRLGPAGKEGTRARAIELTTTALQFDPAQGVAWTEQPVRFAFPQGTGEAVGLRYQSTEPRVLLEKELAVQVTGGGSAPVHIRGAQLHFFSDAQAFELVPPLSVVVGNRTLRADRLRMELDRDFRTRHIEASGHVRAQSEQDGRRLNMLAAQAVASYGENGRIQDLRVTGGVNFQSESRGSREELTCQEAVFEFDPSGGWIERVVATGRAALVSKGAEETRELRAPRLELALRTSTRQHQLLTASQRGTLLVERRGGERRQVVGDEIKLQIESRQRLRGLAASGAVEMKETRPDGAERSTRSEELRARFDGEGKLVEAEQWGRFRYEGGPWQAEAGRARYRAADESLVLQEQPVVWDATTRTRAQQIEVNEKAGLLRAEGEVRTSRQPTADAPRGFGGSDPLHLAAERMQAETGRGWARYEGQARMWQGENRLATAALELFRSPARLVATGNVSALFVEATAQKKTADAATSRESVNVTAGRFTYTDTERRGLFEEKVTARDGFGTLTAPRLEIFLAAGQRLERAHARGGIRIQQRGGQASSEEAEYRAEEQTVVLWGGKPTLSDPQRGITTGARLTLSLADGSIAVESAEGTRTVTRRQWTQ